MIVSCGEALVDLVPEPVAGGGPMNVSIAAARLGVPAAFVGGISTDTFGDMLWQHLASNGVDLTLCPRLDAPTAKAIVEHVPELRFRFEGAGTADTLLAGADLTRLGPGPHIVHGGTLGMFRGTTAETLARSGRIARRHRLARLQRAPADHRRSRTVAPLPRSLVDPHQHLQGLERGLRLDLARAFDGIVRRAADLERHRGRRA